VEGNQRETKQTCRQTAWRLASVPEREALESAVIFHRHRQCLVQNAILDPTTRVPEPIHGAERSRHAAGRTVMDETDWSSR